VNSKTAKPRNIFISLLRRDQLLSLLRLGSEVEDDVGVGSDREGSYGAAGSDTPCSGGTKTPDRFLSSYVSSYAVSRFGALQLSRRLPSLASLN